MLHTRDLCFSYPDGPEFRFPDLTVRSKEVLLVLGPSGKGKTTLLHLLAGLMEPGSGTVSIDGTCLNDLSGRARDRFRGHNIGIIFQQARFIRSVSVMQNLQLARTLSGGSPDLPFGRALMTELGIAEKADLRPYRLSTGERQRAGIARALITRPKVVLADEPTSALDDVNCHAVADLLERTVTGHGAALVIVTHDQRLKERFQLAVQL